MVYAWHMVISYGLDDVGWSAGDLGILIGCCFAVHICSLRTGWQRRLRSPASRRRRGGIVPRRSAESRRLLVVSFAINWGLRTGMVWNSIIYAHNVSPSASQPRRSNFFLLRDNICFSLCNDYHWRTVCPTESIVHWIFHIQDNAMSWTSRCCDAATSICYRLASDIGKKYYLYMCKHMTVLVLLIQVQKIQVLYQHESQTEPDVITPLLPRLDG